MEEIIEVIKTFKEDHPHIVITQQMIKDIIDEYKDKLAEEIQKEL